ncbi:hypothetical protein BJV74DRAFT_145229 [Russula compacta]|nr:hypothetical protein BJV74DRAFT_145229 [Russula compacta]
METAWRPYFTASHEITEKWDCGARVILRQQQTVARIVGMTPRTANSATMSCARSLNAKTVKRQLWPDNSTAFDPICHPEANALQASKNSLTGCLEMEATALRGFYQLGLYRRTADETAIGFMPALWSLSCAMESLGTRFWETFLVCARKVPLTLTKTQCVVCSEPGSQLPWLSWVAPEVRGQGWGRDSRRMEKWPFWLVSTGDNKTPKSMTNGTRCQCAARRGEAIIKSKGAGPTSRLQRQRRFIHDKGSTGSWHHPT